MGVSIKDIDNDNASFSEGTLTDVVAVNDGLQLGPASLTNNLNYSWYNTGTWYSNNGHPTNEPQMDAFFDSTNSGVSFGGNGIHSSSIFWGDASQTVSWGGTVNSKPSYLPTDGYSWKVEGYIYCPKDGEYYFITDSDDASDAFIDGVKVCDFYGGHGFYNTGANRNVYPITLSEGLHKIKVRMEEGAGGDGIALAWKKPNDTSYFTIPASNFSNERYLSQGIRQSPQLDLSSITQVGSSSISWTETLNSQTITIETSVDGGSTWQAATNGGAIPNLPANPTTLDVRQILDTNDTTVTPVLESLTVDIDTAEENTDSGSLAEGETYTFYPFQFTDSGSLIGAEEDNGIKIKPQNDSGSFNIDAENWYTRVTTAFDEGSLTSEIENYDLEGWIQNPKATSQWQNVDENTQDLWTKVDKNTADWNKG